MSHRGTQGGAQRGGPRGGQRGGGGRPRPQGPRVTKSHRPRFRYLLVRVSGPPNARLGNDTIGSEIANSAHRVPGSDAKIVEVSPAHAIVRIRRGTERGVRAELNHTFRARDQEFTLQTVTISGTLKALRERGGLPPRPAEWKMRRYSEMRNRRK